MLADEAVIQQTVLNTEQEHEAQQKQQSTMFMLLKKTLNLPAARMCRKRSRGLLAIAVLLVLAGHRAATADSWQQERNKQSEAALYAKPNVELKSANGRLDHLAARLARWIPRPPGQVLQRQQGKHIFGDASEASRESQRKAAARLRFDRVISTIPSSKPFMHSANEDIASWYLRFVVPLVISELTAHRSNSSDWDDSSEDSYDSGYSWAQFQGSASADDCRNTFSGLFWGGDGWEDFTDGCYSYLNSEGLLDVFNESTSEYDD